MYLASAPTVALTISLAAAGRRDQPHIRNANIGGPLVLNPVTGASAEASRPGEADAITYRGPPANLDLVAGAELAHLTHGA